MDIFNFIDKSYIERIKVSHMFIYMEINLLAKDDDELDKDKLNRYSVKLNWNDKIIWK